MYSKLYYDEKIKPIIEEVEDELGNVELSTGEKLNLRKRIARDLYEGMMMLRNLSLPNLRREPR
jgi:hypothetical protein